MNPLIGISKRLSHCDFIQNNKSKLRNSDRLGWILPGRLLQFMRRFGLDPVPCNLGLANSSACLNPQISSWRTQEEFSRLDPVPSYLEPEDSPAGCNTKISSWRTQEEFSRLDPVLSYLEPEDSPAGINPQISSWWTHEEIWGWILFLLIWSWRIVQLIVILRSLPGGHTRRFRAGSSSVLPGVRG